MSVLPSSVQSYTSSTIEVTGEGNLFVQPDRAIVTLGVTTENKDVSTSQQENAEVMAKIITALGNLGIPKANMKTIDYRIEAQYDYENGMQILRGYKTTHLLQVSVDQPSQVGKVIDTAVAAGANTVSSIQFTLAHPEQFYNHTLSLALLNAYQKALTLSNTIGATLNRVPLKVEEVPQATAPLSQPIMFLSKSEGTPIEAGQLQIKAAIRATFSYHL